MKTILYDQHLALDAKIVNFSDWDMPIYYTGIIAEHHAVRKNAGLFDVSHMGRIVIEGADAEIFLDFLSTNHIRGKPPKSAVYTVWPNESGGSVDDVIIYKESDNRFFAIVNAGNRQKDLQHLKDHRRGLDVSITPLFEEEAILSLQGPLSKEILQLLFPDALFPAPMHFIYAEYRGHNVIISATGYTGAGGFELYLPNAVVQDLWKDFLILGKPFGLIPVGLGARDTLRLEMGYALYGHELSDDILPAESVSSWTIKADKHDFLGKEYQKNKKRSQYGAILSGDGIARAGNIVFKDGMQIGYVTSGTFSPTLQLAIVILMSDIPLKENDLIEIKLRQHNCPAKIVKLPFVHQNHN